MTHTQMIAAIQAAKDGEKMQQSPLGSGRWYDIDDIAGIRWDFTQRDFRAKPEPREWWVNVYADCSALCDTKEEAESKAVTGRLECFRVVEKPEE